MGKELEHNGVGLTRPFPNPPLNYPDFYPTNQNNPQEFNPIAMANCVLPEDIMLCILTRLPVKAILRFKSVCKPWLHLFSTPEFQKLHLDQFSSDPENQSFIVHSFGEYCNEQKFQYSIFNIESGKKRPTILDYPVAHTQNIVLDTVGCCNGLVCILSGQEIVLWNPAMKLSKTVPLKDCGPSEMVSLGFGYDAVGADFKVVRVVGERSTVGGEGMNVTYVEMYSVNLDSWITINVGCRFSEFRARDFEYGGEHLIVNGNPYWFARVDGKDVLVCFDVMELVFKIVPLPSIYWNGLGEEAGTEVDMVDLNGLNEEKKIKTATQVDLVDWNGALAAILSIINIVPTDQNYNEYHSRVESLWVFDDVKRIWRKNKTFAPIEVNVGTVLHYTKNGKVLGNRCYGGALFMLDSDAGCVEKLFDGACLGSSFEVFGYDVYGYTESLAYIDGMEKVVVKYNQKDFDDCFEDDVGAC